MGLNSWRILRVVPVVGDESTEELEDKTEKRLTVLAVLMKEFRIIDERFIWTIEPRGLGAAAVKVNAKGLGEKGRGKLPDCRWNSRIS
jgi:hypothetical protein